MKKDIYEKLKKRSEHFPLNSPLNKFFKGLKQFKELNQTKKRFISNTPSFIKYAVIIFILMLSLIITGFPFLKNILVNYKYKSLLYTELMESTTNYQQINLNFKKSYYFSESLFETTDDIDY